MDSIVLILGYIAGFFTTISFLPQVIKTWKTKSTKDISLIMFILFVLGISLWFVYGLMEKSLPIIIANALTGAMGLMILYFKIRYK
jgi:MtN3 and saliva related transmembrane protein